jgi:hypothetical protein
MPGDDDIELAALKTVCGVDHHRSGGDPQPRQAAVISALTIARWSRWTTPTAMLVAWPRVVSDAERERARRGNPL